MRDKCSTAASVRKEQSDKFISVISKDDIGADSSSV